MHLHHFPPPRKSIIQGKTGKNTQNHPILIPVTIILLKPVCKVGGWKAGQSRVYMLKMVLFSVLNCIQNFQCVCVGGELRMERGGETNLFG